MKKSQMIMELATEIVLYDHQIDYGAAKDLAITVLQKAEELGMLPPTIKIKFGTVDYNDNAWEKEE